MSAISSESAGRDEGTTRLSSCREPVSRPHACSRRDAASAMSSTGGRLRRADAIGDGTWSVFGTDYLTETCAAAWCIGDVQEDTRTCCRRTDLCWLAERGHAMRSETGICILSACRRLFPSTAGVLNGRWRFERSRRCSAAVLVAISDDGTC